MTSQFDMGWVWRWGSYLPNSLGQRPHGWFLRLGRYCLQRVTPGDVAHIMITQIIQSRQGRVLSGSSLEFWILSLLSIIIHNPLLSIIIHYKLLLWVIWFIIKLLLSIINYYHSLSIIIHSSFHGTHILLPCDEFQRVSAQFQPSFSTLKSTHLIRLSAQDLSCIFNKWSFVAGKSPLWTSNWK